MALQLYRNNVGIDSSFVIQFPSDVILKKEEPYNKKDALFTYLYCGIA